MRLGGTVVTCSLLTATAWVQVLAAAWVWLCSHVGVFHPSQPMPGGFPLGFSSTLRRARNCSDWNHLIRSTGLARTCSGWRKINGFTFTCISTWFCYHWDIPVNLWNAHLLIHSDEILFWTSLEIGSKMVKQKGFCEDLLITNQNLSFWGYFQHFWKMSIFFRV